VNVGELFRLARLLREVAIEAARGPDEPAAAPGLVAITDDIARHDGTSVGEIAARTGLAQSLVSKTVAHLRDAGVVDVCVDASDRRRSRITITQTARSQIFATRGARTVTKALHEHFPALSAECVTRIEALLDRLATELLDAPASRSESVSRPDRV
jgi:DNA-binding MarR family transcriptional regulator